MSRSRSEHLVEVERKMKTREASSEAYRIALMLGICVLHAMSFGSNRCVFAENALMPCVVGFAFISGWFSIRWSVGKVVRLLGIGLYATLCNAAVFGCVTGDWREVVKLFLPTFYSHWFLYAYLFMMCLAPLVNRTIVGAKGEWAHVMPLLALSWLWGFGRTLPHGTEWLPSTSGLDAYGGLTLLAAYAGARYCRVHDVLSRVPHRLLPFLAMALVVAAGIGFGDYNSPVAFALAACSFMLLRRLLEAVETSSCLGRLVGFLAPSMFSIYLIHASPLGFGRRLVAFLEDWLIGSVHLPVACAIVVTGLLIFCLCFLLDIPRRLVVRLLK